MTLRFWSSGRRLERASRLVGELVSLARQAGLPVALAPSVTPRLAPEALVELKHLGVMSVSISLDVDLDEGTVRIGWSRRIGNGRMQVKGPKTEAGYRTVVLGPSTLAALKGLRSEQTERRLALGAGYHADQERRLACLALGEQPVEDEYLVICKADGRPYRPDSTSPQFRRFVDDNSLPRSLATGTAARSRSRSTSTRWPRALPAPAWSRLSRFRWWMAARMGFEPMDASRRQRFSRSATAVRGGPARRGEVRPQAL